MPHLSTDLRICWRDVPGADGSVIRSTHPSRPDKVGLKCPSVRPQNVSSISVKFGM